MVKYTEEKIVVSGVELYKLEPQDANPRIGENVYAAKTAIIGEEAIIGAWAIIGEEARIGEGARIGAWANIGEDAIIGEDASIGERARIGKYDFLLIGPIGSRNAYTSIWRHKDGGYRVSCGCFNGTLEEFEARVEKVHGDNQHGRAYKAAIAMARACLNGMEGK